MMACTTTLDCTAQFERELLSLSSYHKTREKQYICSSFIDNHCQYEFLKYHHSLPFFTIILSHILLKYTILEVRKVQSVRHRPYFVTN